MINNPESTNIRAVVVNHNTSNYTELVLRSLFAMHDQSLDISITVMDNASDDDMRDLKSYADKMAVPIVQSGFTVADEMKSRGIYGENVHGVESHGEILSRFILENNQCKYYLLLDADICFVERNTIPTMVAELEMQPDVFGVGVRQSHGGGKLVEMPNPNPHIYETRLHPCCALIKNTPLFRRVVEEVGISGMKLRLAAGECICTTGTLMTKVMKTHGLRHMISKAIAIHMFAVSYNEREREGNDAWCANLLRPLREQQNSETAPAD